MEGEVDNVMVDNESDSLPPSTQISRARLAVMTACIYTINYICRSIIEKQQISHNQALGVFTVLGTTGNPHSIRLSPARVRLHLAAIT